MANYFYRFVARRDDGTLCSVAGYVKWELNKWVEHTPSSAPRNEMLCFEGLHYCLGLFNALHHRRGTVLVKVERSGEVYASSSVKATCQRLRLVRVYNMDDLVWLAKLAAALTIGFIKITNQWELRPLAAILVATNAAAAHAAYVAAYAAAVDAAANVVNAAANAAAAAAHAAYAAYAAAAAAADATAANAAYADADAADAATAANAAANATTAAATAAYAAAYAADADAARAADASEEMKLNFNRLGGVMLKTQNKEAFLRKVLKRELQ